MEYSYVAYAQDRRLIKGRVNAVSPEAAGRQLARSGYQVLSLKLFTPFVGGSRFGRARVKPSEIILFSRQMALLLESGTDIVTSLELLEQQTTNSGFKKTIAEIVSDIRSGSSLSMALSRHPRVFPQLYHRVISAGEQGGSLEVVLRSMADFTQRSAETEKKVRGALTYPAIVLVVATLVVLLLVTFVLPSFTSLYTQLGANLPATTKILVSITDFFFKWGIFVIAGFIGIVTVLVLYFRTPQGKYTRDKAALRLPVLGRIVLLSELSRACQTMSLLFKAGLPLPEIMTQATRAANNKLVADALAAVQHDLIRGEGLSRPMAKSSLFLPLMVQMVHVGEETGRLDDTLATVARTYDTETDDRITSAVGLIQPVMTIVIGIVVAFIAVAMLSSMYSVYGQFSGGQ